MSNRILRDTTDSEKVNKLSAPAEVLFYRLMMKADDYGAYHGSLALIRANLYPLKLDEVAEEHIAAWMGQLQRVGLLEAYQVGGKKYIQILNFGQRLRNMKKRFPERSESAIKENRQQPAATGGEVRPETETEDETETGNRKQNSKQKSKQKEIAAAGRINIFDFSENLKTNQDWIIATAEAMEVFNGDPEKVKIGIDKFNRHLTTLQIKEKTAKDYLEHFSNWSRKIKNITPSKNGKHQNDRKEPRNSETRGFGKI